MPVAESDSGVQVGDSAHSGEHAAVQRARLLPRRLLLADGVLCAGEVLRRTGLGSVQGCLVCYVSASSGVMLALTAARCVCGNFEKKQKSVATGKGAHLLLVIAALFSTQLVGHFVFRH